MTEPFTSEPALTLTPGGSAAGVLGEAASAGGGNDAENAWLSDRDYAGEVVFQHVAQGLLLGRDIVDSGKAKLGRNLLTEAEHRAHTRAGRDLLARASKADAKSDTAGDPGVSYLRDNADSLLEEAATKQAKAAQTLIDAYGKLAPLRQERQTVGDLIPDAPVDQARWAQLTSKELDDDLGALPSSLAAPLRERLATLSEGDDPAAWFTSASELSDELLKARAKAGRSAADPALLETIDRAKERLDKGLANESLWGRAALVEGQRSAGFSRRYGDHIDAFEEAFTSEVDGQRRVDPAAFRSLLDSSDPSQMSVLARTLDSARVTADTAKKFGKKDEAAAITSAIRQLERSGKQASAIQAARGVSRETVDPSSAALEWLMSGREGLGGEGVDRALLDSAKTGETNAAAEAAAQRLAARGSVFRATATLAQVARASSKAGVQTLLAAQNDAEEADDVAEERSALGVPLLEFDAHRAHIEKMARDPNYFGDVMAASFGTMPEAAPEVYRELSAQAAKTVQYLDAIAPGGSTGGPFAERIPVSEDDVWEYNERLRAVAEPEYVRREISAGRLSSQSIEAFEMMHSKQYAQLQQDVFERLQELKEQGIRVPIQAREQLDVLLNLDGGGEPGLTWKVAERAYAAQQRKAAAASGQEAGGSERTAMQSGALATLGNGASAVAQTG